VLLHAKKKKVTLYFNVFVLQLLNMYVLSNNNYLGLTVK